MNDEANAAARTHRQKQADGRVRLAKRVAELKSCSRREAEQYVEGGWVRVDGKVIEEPQFKVAGERIDIDADARPGSVESVTLLLHKPAGFDAGPNGQSSIALITAASRSSLDQSGMRMINRHFAHLKPMMPLEAPASGLMVLTQDFRVERKLKEDAAMIEHEFVVEVAASDSALTAVMPAAPVEGSSGVAQAEKIATARARVLNRLNHGIPFNGRPPPHIKASWQNETRLRIAIKDVRPGQIGFMCERVGLTVVAMRRIRIGRIPMAGLLPGQWRYLGDGEKF